MPDRLFQKKDDKPKKRAVCNTCTKHLVEIAYRRTWWFRPFREPMVIGMKLMSLYHRIDPTEFDVRNKECYGCIRFMKTALKEKSPTFLWLNDRINPLFNRVRNSVVTEVEIEEARRFAAEATGEDNKKE